jgi:hypothetical protein
VLEVMQEAGSLFERGGELVRIRGDRMLATDKHWLNHYLAQRISFTQTKVNADGSTVTMRVGPPNWLAKRINALSEDRGLPETEGVIIAPTLRLDGSLLDRPGFDEPTGLLLLPGEWPAIPKKPSRDEMRAAWGVLWKPYSLFPYVSDSDRAVTPAGILTALIRRVLPTAPAFSFDAPMASSGKTLLANTVGIMTGSAPSVIPESAEEDEVRKKLLPALLSGQPALLFDNIKGSFISSAIEAMLGSPHETEKIVR